MIVKQRFLKTKEDWHGTFEPNTDDNPYKSPAVQVILFKLNEVDWRLLVTGNDDYGLELDTTKEKAIFFYNKLKHFVTHVEIQLIGFKHK